MGVLVTQIPFRRKIFAQESADYFLSVKKTNDSIPVFRLYIDTKKLKTDEDIESFVDSFREKAKESLSENIEVGWNLERKDSAQKFIGIAPGKIPIDNPQDDLHAYEPEEKSLKAIQQFCDEISVSIAARDFKNR